MREGYGTMMRITLLDQYVTIEATHLWNSEDTDTTERTCRNIEHLALSDVRTQVALRVALQTIECDVAGSNVTLQSTRVKSGLPPFSNRRFWMS